jgi:hypothetical protein
MQLTPQFIFHAFTLVKCRRLSTTTKLILHKALTGSVKTYAYPALGFPADTDLLKLKSLRNKTLHTAGNFPRRTPTGELHAAFPIQYACDSITQLFRQQAEVVHNHAYVTVRNIGQSEAMYRKYKRLKLGGGRAYDRSSD